MLVTRFIICLFYRRFLDNNSYLLQNIHVLALKDFRKVKVTRNLILFSQSEIVLLSI